MANYYGNDIGDAARSEERALQRALDLAIANRSFAANERSRSDAIDSANAAARQNAYSQALALEQADRTNRLNLALAAQDKAYSRGQDELRTRLGLSEAEKGRALQRELYGNRQDQYDERLASKEADSIYRDIAKRVGANDIQDIPALQDAEAGRLSSDQWIDLRTRLGQHQQRLKTESALGPEAAASEATAILQNDPLFATSTTPQDKARAMVNVLQRLDASRVYSGKIAPDMATFTFKPRREYKYSGAMDAVDQSRLPPERNPVADYSGSYQRLFFSPESGANYPSRMGVAPEPALPSTNYAPAPAPVAPPQAIADPRAEEVRDLVGKGVPRDQAILLVARKYQRLRSSMGGREPIRTY